MRKEGKILKCVCISLIHSTSNYWEYAFCQIFFLILKKQTMVLHI